MEKKDKFDYEALKKKTLEQLTQRLYLILKLCPESSILHFNLEYGNAPLQVTFYILLNPIL